MKCAGVAYQLTPDDPLVNTDQCKLDASLMKDLGANSVRVYHVDPLGDHKGCMDAFANNGIYVFVDLDTFTTQIEPVSDDRSVLIVLITNVYMLWSRTTSTGTRRN